MVKSYTVGLVGESHYQENIDHRTEGCSVEFVIEPDNPHDPRAIRVDDEWDRTIGYLPRDGWLTEAILDHKKPVAAYVLSVAEGRGPNQGIVLDVAVGEQAVRERLAVPPKGSGCLLLLGFFGTMVAGIAGQVSA